MATSNKAGTGKNTPAKRQTTKGNTNSSRNTSNRSTYNRSQGAINSKTTSNRKKAEEFNPRKNEIKLFAYLAIAVFLICSSFGWCGIVGNFISKIVFGLFGMVSYVLPLYMFLSAAFLLSNGAKKSVVRRVLCVAVFIIAAAFICQLSSGGVMSAEELYNLGSVEKKGGGVILGGLLVLLHKFIGLTGSIIVIVLLITIGIIIVLDVSIIESVKSKIEFFLEDDEEDFEEEFDFEAKNARRQENRNKDILRSIKVLEPEESKKTKERKKKRQIVNEEEVHELKPLKPTDFFEFEDLSQDDFNSGDKFNKPETDFGFEDKDEVVELSPVKRKKKRTKESQAEMEAERDNIARSIAGLSEELSGINPFSSYDEAKNDKKSENLNTTEAVNNSSYVNKMETADKPEYVFPPIDLLKTAKGKGKNNNENQVRETAMKLKRTLENFGVNVTITDYSCGPAVTRYELQPEQGVKVSKITNLADDIKLNLAAADIRIEAPIPGKAAIGIEVPNKESSAVYFRDLLDTETFKKFPSNIAFAVGKDISGQVVVADIAKMPHLLIAGATGSGKSVCINTLIMSILYKANPEDVKMIMVDPKQVELSIYNGIPHMLIPVVTDPKKAAGALNWAVMEMTNRYQLFAQYNVRNLQGYNEKVETIKAEMPDSDELKKLPQIVIIVDELADLMMVAHGEVEDAIVRLSQLARAAGIHLVIATQRPSVDVITGLIKANVPSRIAMTVSSGVDSRTILDMNGAEKLLGKGDMLFYPTGYPKPVRVQGAFLSDDEIADVVAFLKSQGTENNYDEKVVAEISSQSQTSIGDSGSGGSDYDEYFADAGKFIIGKDKASIGMLQRVYKIGFNRAARIMDQLSDAGVVGPEEGTKPRKVLMSMEEFENFVEQNL